MPSDSGPNANTVPVDGAEEVQDESGTSQDSGATVDSDSDSNPGSISVAIAGIGADDDHAATDLWNRYFQRLGTYAKKKIFPRLLRHFDEDDIANSTFMALVKGLRESRFDKVTNRDELWQMMTIIASRKIANATKFFDRQKRGGGKVKGESVFGESGIYSVADMVSHVFSENEYDQFEKICDELLCGISDERTRQVAVLRLQGYSIAEIAEKLGVAPRTIDRELALIREFWNESLEE